jgi:hypothetical protein
MTYDEKVAYRAEHRVPNTIDKWIADGKTRTRAPIPDPYKRGPSLKHFLRQDDVECILNVIFKEVYIRLAWVLPTSLFVRDLTIKTPTNSH